MSKLERGTIESRDHARAGAQIGAATTPGKHTLVEAIPDGSAAPSPAQRAGAATADASAVGSAPTLHAAAAHGIVGNSHGLPFGDTIQRLFGRHDIGSIRAHTDEAAGAGARAMGARAFATGDHVAFASPPDLHTDDGLRNETKPSKRGEDQHANQGMDPSNVESFVRGLTDAVAPDVRVLLYGCSAGEGPAPDGSPRNDAPANGPAPMNDLAGKGSLAQSLAQLLGPKVSVYAHSTTGNVTGNPSARVFGAEGGGQYGISMFELMYPEYIQAQLKALSLPADGAHYDALREEMLRHFDNSVHDLVGQRRYNVNPNADEFSPIGREMFINPAHARELLHADWETWIKDPAHLARVTQLTLK